MYIFIIYIVIINIIGYFAMWFDKRQAIKGRRRIPERSLMSIAMFFGAAGIMMGMRRFNHKTRHPKFSVGVPLIFTFELIAAIVFFLI